MKHREAWMPVASGSFARPRQRMTGIVLDHLGHLNDDDRVFPFGRSRAYQIVHAMSPDFWCHLPRALGENFLYDAWNTIWWLSRTTLR